MSVAPLNPAPLGTVPVIAGCGLVTPLGAGVEATWQALLAGRFITDHGRAPLAPASCVSRVSQLALHSIAELGRIAPDTALVVGTSKGAVESWLKPDSKAGGLRPTGLASVAGDVARHLQLEGPRLTVSAACASGLQALARAAMMIRSGQAARVLVVAVESSLHPLFLGSFQRLGVLATPGSGCKPFDANRDGFLMSEAAAAVLLVGQAIPAAPQDTEERQARPDLHPAGAVIVDRCAIGGDATHLTGSDPEASLLRRLIQQVTGDQSLDLVHAHATGTVLNDESELRAIDDCCAGQLIAPAVYSHKAALGHSLGAAGLVSIAINWLAHQRGVVPPNVQTRRPLPARHVSIEQGPQARRVRRSLAVASGFGGATAAVTLRTIGVD